jgi:quercetin dioxygenase-like cupin family protein
MIIGRTLQNDGTPVQDTGIEIDPDGPTAELLRKSVTPLISNPLNGDYVTILELPEQTNGEYLKALLISHKNASGPPKHFHPSYYEDFEVIEGEFEFFLNGKNKKFSAGDSLLVKPGDIHTFRATDSHQVNVYLVKIHPPSEMLIPLVNTLAGLAHEGKLSNKGPGFWQGMAFSRELMDDTIFTTPPLPVQKCLTTLFGPIASLLGYKATYPKYMENRFWTKRVEQFKEFEEYFAPAWGK